jgi:hypothetical protein
MGTPTLSKEGVGTRRPYLPTLSTNNLAVMALLQLKGDFRTPPIQGRVVCTSSLDIGFLETTGPRGTRQDLTTKGVNTPCHHNTSIRGFVPQRHSTPDPPREKQYQVPATGISTRGTQGTPHGVARLMTRQVVLSSRLNPHHLLHYIG